MPHTLSVVALAAICGLALLAYADTPPTAVRQTSATIILHEGVTDTKPGEVPLDPKLCRPETFGQIHIVNDRVHICRKRG